MNINQTRHAETFSTEISKRTSVRKKKKKKMFASNSRANKNA